MRRLACFALVTLLAGCATPAERAAQMEREVDEMIQVYGPACERLGYRGATDGWRDCVLGLSAKDSYERYRRSTTTCLGHRGFFQCSTF